MLPGTLKKRLRFAACERGGVLIVTALILPVALSLIGMGVDYGKWLEQRANLQSAADAAALAGALAYQETFDKDAAKDAATGVVDAHGLSDAIPGYSFAEGGYQVTLQKPGTKFFSGLVPTDPPLLRATAVASLPEEEGDKVDIRLIR